MSESTNKHTKNAPLSRPLIWVLLLAPIICFYTYVNHFAVNIGWNDDFHGIEGFLASWMQQETWSDKLTLLFSQMCDHRILWVRLSTLFGYNVLGEVNYKFMMLMGVSYLLVLPFVFYRVLKSINLGLAYLIPIIFIIFNIQPIENIFWAITSLQPNVVIIFGLWAFSLILFTKNKLYFVLANILIFIAMFTNGNGMFAFLGAIPLVLYTRTKIEKVAYFAFVAFCFWLYFHNFHKVGIRPNPIINITQYPHLIIGDFFAFFGSPIDSTIQFYDIFLKHTTAILVGILMIGWVLYLVISFGVYYYTSSQPFSSKEKGFIAHFHKSGQKIAQNPEFNLFLLAAFIFVGLSGLAFSVSRAKQGIEEAFNSRYKTVSIILFIIVYLSSFNFINVQKRVKYLKISIIITLFFNLFSYYASTDDVLNYRRFLTTSMLNWKNNGRYYYYAFGEKSRYPQDDHAPISKYKKLPIPPLNYAGFVEGIMKYVNDILWLSRKHYKNYTPPKEVDELNNILFESPIVNNNTTNELINIKEEPNRFVFDIQNADIAFSPMRSGYYVTFVEQKNTTRLAFVLNTQANKFTTFLTTQHYYSNRIDWTIAKPEVAKPDLPVGTYTMRLGKIQNDKFIVLKEIQNIIIK